METFSDTNVDADYRDRVQTALFEATVRASMTDGIAMMKTGEIVDAALSLIALMISGSAETASPAKRRDAVDRIAKKLLRKTVAVQDEIAVSGWPERFVNLNSGDVH